MPGLFERFKKALAVLPMLFSPPESISTRQMRILGLLTWLAGLSLLLLLSVIIPIIAPFMINQGVGGVVMILLLGSYGLMSIGGYRIFTGKDEPWYLEASDVSFPRILRIVVALVGSMLVAAALVVAMLYMFEWMGFSPKDWFR